jgi:ABC-type Fe3+/spermidine/putrescine transport system ATPase subunit
MKPLLEIVGLSHRYGSTVVIDDLSLSLEAGRHLALTGPSGCGKSTLLRLIAGLEAPLKGAILIEGRSATLDSRIYLPPHRRSVAMVFQDLALWPNLTALANVELGLASTELSHKEKRERAAEALALCRISDLGSRKPAQLSGGQQQRVALARALAVRPKLLLLDEPFTGLDAALKAQIIADLTDLSTLHHITLLAATHDPEEAEALACEVWGMKCNV